MPKSHLLPIILSLIFAFEVAAFSQDDISTNQMKSSDEPAEIIAQGLYAGETQALGVRCPNVKDNSGDKFLDTLVPGLVDEIKTAFQLNATRALSYAFVDNDFLAYAIDTGYCETRAKGKRLLLIGKYAIEQRLLDLKDVIGKQIEDQRKLNALKKTSNAEYQALLNEKEFLLVAVIAHEMAHFKQNELNIPLKEKELELHADFLAGWYLAQYAEKKNLERSTRLRAVLAAASKFYLLGLDNKPGTNYGTPENRMQILLDGYQASSKKVELAYSDGIAVINQNPIYQNPPDVFGLEIKEHVDNLLKGQNPFTLLKRSCVIKQSGRVINSRCQLPRNDIENLSYEMLEKGILSYLPKQSTISRGSSSTEFSAVNPFFPLRSVKLSQDTNKILLTFEVLIPDDRIPLKTVPTEMSKNRLSEELQTEIQKLSRRATTSDVREVNIWGTKCSAFPKSKENETWYVMCKLNSNNIDSDFREKKDAVSDWLPVNFRVLENDDELFAFNRSYTPVKEIGVRRQGGEVILTINVMGNVPSENVVTEKRALNLLAQEFKNQTQGVNQSTEIPKFSFLNRDCQISEGANLLDWDVRCDLLPDKEKGETSESLYKEARDAVWSWAPAQWRERESDTFYSVTPGKMALIPNPVQVVEIKRSLTDVVLFLKIEVNGVKAGIDPPRPNKLGEEILNQIKLRRELKSNQSPSFALSGQSCFVTANNVITCKFPKSVGFKFEDIKTSVISIFPGDWRYSSKKIYKGTLFVAMKKTPDQCNEEINQSITCQINTVTLSDNEKEVVLSMIIQPIEKHKKP